MKKLNKVLALALTVCMACPPLVGCQKNASSKTSSSATPQHVTITIWHEAEAGVVKPLQAELNKLSPNITVKLQRKDHMSDALKLVGNDPSSAPDMYLMAHDKTGTYAEMGILAPITDFVSKSDMKDLLPMTVNASLYKGVNYQLPIFFETQMLIYNKKLMTNPPKTTDDWLAYMKANTNKKAGKYALVEQHSTAYYAAAWMHAFGATIINNNAQPQLNTKAMKDAVTYHKQFADYEPTDGEFNTDTALFTQGKAAAIIQGPWFIPAVKAAGINYGVAEMPTVNSTGKVLAPYAGVQGMYVLKNSENTKKDAITAVLRQLLKPDIGIGLATAADEAPANTKCYNNSSVSSNADLMNMRKTAETAVAMQNMPEMDVMWTVTENALSAVNKNNKDASSQFDDAQKKALDGIAAMK